MQKNNIVINTLVFLEDLNNGVKQSKLLKDIHDLGINKVEVRREFIKDFETELLEIRDISEELQMEIYYSVPRYLYAGGELNIDEIEESFKEADKMNCRNVKFNIGDYNHLSSENVYIINSLCDKYSIKLTIENDQTKENGQVKKIQEFLQDAETFGMKVSCTFDIGNWLWQKEEPIENAYKLKPYVTYIHLKDVYMKDKPQATILNQGIIPWINILHIFDRKIPVAIEYPCFPDTLAGLNKEINKLQDMN
ncbi:sugar phosphate isomerase/epimerase [Clostridium sp. CF012]|uniref:sugar phosphate isomerase/epimerase family protein n=1 Tax=Clostridium sp. CF012 TaxID=2843319 RepID=UPI001C0CD428|nr:TIM barrel protein [Clostridium sp. CF012]MBU3142818.1 sugar phosphate isomerase/epimerase [Clostridium sp. CF012]